MPAGSDAVTVLRLDRSIALLSFEGLSLVAPGERPSRLQSILRRATGRQDIAVSRRPSRRPCLKPPLPELGISASHRGVASVIGFSDCCAVGVDIEMPPRTAAFDPYRMGRDHYARAEGVAIAGLEGEAALSLFLLLWVAKEALLKVSGQGIVDGLARPDLSRYLDALISGARCSGFAMLEGRDAEVVVTVVRRSGEVPLYVALAQQSDTCATSPSQTRLASGSFGAVTRFVT
ncbi:MAG: 4'-phosphopantetheinyl transferase family protein [Hyphomicrobiaceae bacterium]